MSLLALSHLGKSYGSKILFEDVTININRNEKIGFIGNNGTGKSTLFKIIMDIEKSDTGEVNIAKEIKIGYVAQEISLNSENSVYDEVSCHFKELYLLRKEIKKVESEMEKLSDESSNMEKILKKYDRLSEECYQKGGYDFEYRIESILKGLKIPESDWNRKISSFSGGEKNRISLARELVKNPDILLLDEPENHLDYDGMEWLEDFIKNYENSVIIISHNRHLLDKCIDRIWNLESKKIEIHKGNYSAFRLFQLEERMRARKQFDENQKKIKRLKFTIERLKSWGNVYDNPSLAKKAKSIERRKNRLEDETTIEKMNTNRINFSFKKVKSSGDIVLKIDGYSKKFGDNILFENTGFDIFKNQRVALIGPNGCGKTTLIEDIINNSHWENPVLRKGKSVTISYYSQMHAKLNPKNTILKELIEVTNGNDVRAKQLLRNFLFTDEEFGKSVSSLSGGEKARVQLASLLETESNFLILDEPTNHLDISSREMVEEALEDYNGSLLIVSHDRYFLDKIVDSVVIIENKKLNMIQGNFSSWWKNRKLNKLKKMKKVEKRKKKIVADKENELEKKILEIEEEIEKLEFKKQEIEFTMAKNINERGKHHSVKNLKELKGITSKIELLYKKWEETAEKM